MGAAPDWQPQVVAALSDLPITVLNPRRPDWDRTIPQSIKEPRFKEQVVWELDGLERADLVLLYLAPGTVSPISLLELGLFRYSKDLIVCCPPGFARKGNVEVVLDYYGDEPPVEDFARFLTLARQEVETLIQFYSSPAQDAGISDVVEGTTSS